MKKQKELEETLFSQTKARIKKMLSLIKKGVHIVDPFTTYIADNARIGKGTTIYPLTVIEENVCIGRNCSIGPFTRIRKGTTLKGHVVLGNFVEVNRSTISKFSKAKHLTYLGDTYVEEKVNIGAGTIVANYDGKSKHPTRIKKHAFIGCGTILIAPLQVGRGAITGAGSVVTKNKNVPDNTVVVGIPAKVLKKNR